MAIAAGIPEYVVQGMLGGRQYLDQYNREPLDVKKKFAKKTLRAVSIYSEEKTEEERLTEAGEILGLGKITPEQAARLKETLGMVMTIPKSKLAKKMQED